MNRKAPTKCVPGNSKGVSRYFYVGLVSDVKEKSERNKKRGTYHRI